MLKPSSGTGWEADDRKGDEGNLCQKGVPLILFESSKVTFNKYPSGGLGVGNKTPN